MTSPTAFGNSTEAAACCPEAAALQQVEPAAKVMTATQVKDFAKAWAAFGCVTDDAGPPSSPGTLTPPLSPLDVDFDIFSNALDALIRAWHPVSRATSTHSCTRSASMSS